MGALPQIKYEKFVQEFVELSLAGQKKPAAEAYTRAGFLPGPANARRLANTKAVKARIRERFKEALEYADVRAARLAVQIDRIGRANIADLFEADGKTLRNITTLPKELSAAIASVEFDEEGRPKIKLHDKLAALSTLLKHVGGLPEPERRDVNIFNMLSIDDQRALAEVLELGVSDEPAGAPVAGDETPGERAPG